MKELNRFVEKIEHHTDVKIEGAGPESIPVRFTGDVYCEVWDNSGSAFIKGYGPIPADPFWGSVNVKFNEPLGSSAEIAALKVSVIIFE